MQNGNIPSSYSVPVSASLAFFLSRFRRFTPLSFACFLTFTSRKQTDESSSLEGKFTRLLAHARLALKSWPPSWIGEPRNPGMSTIERPRVWDWDELGKGGGGFLPPPTPLPPPFRSSQSPQFARTKVAAERTAGSYQQHLFCRLMRDPL